MANTNQEIAALKARCTALEQKLAAETAARISADTAEATARANADAVEVSARISADTTEAAVRAAADAALSARIDLIPVPPPPPVNELAALVAASSGNLLTLPAGTIKGTSTIPRAMTIAGAGMGQTVIDCAGFRPAFGKAVLLPLVPGAKIVGVTLKNAANPDTSDNNEAGVRDAGPAPEDPDGNQGFELENVEITDCQNGILTFAGNYIVRGCKFARNGANNGLTHNNYFNGSPTSRVETYDGEYSDCKGGHDIKSRAGTTISDGDRIVKSLAGRAYDFPNGGIAHVKNGSILVPPATSNGVIMMFAAENALNLTTGDTLTIENEFIDNQRTNGVTYIQNHTFMPNAKLVLINVRVKGPFPQLPGWASVTGAFVAGTS